MRLTSIAAISICLLPGGIGTTLSAATFGDFESVLANGGTEVGNYAFSGCHALQEITLSASVTMIGDRAFYDCGSLAAQDLARHGAPPMSIAPGRFGSISGSA